MKNSGLLVIDAQEGLLEDHPTNEGIFIDNVKKRIKSWRNLNKKLSLYDNKIKKI